MSDLDDGIKNTSNALKTFKKNVRQVKDEVRVFLKRSFPLLPPPPLSHRHHTTPQLEAAGVSEEDDPFVRKMTEFYKKAEVESENVETRLKDAKEAYEQVLIYMAAKYNPSKLPDPDEFFSHLCPFLEKFSAEASSILKEMKKREKAGTKITKNTGVCPPPPLSPTRVFSCHTPLTLHRRKTLALRTWSRGSPKILYKVKERGRR